MQNMQNKVRMSSINANSHTKSKVKMGSTELERISRLTNQTPKW